MAEPFSLSAFVITSTVAGILGNRTDAGVVQAWRSVVVRMRQGGSPVNHDIQRGVRKSQLQATLLAAEARLKGLGAEATIARQFAQAIFESDEEIKWLNYARDHINHQLKLLTKPDYVPPPISGETDIELFIASEKGNATEKVHALRDELAGTMLLELRLALPHVPPSFEEMMRGGWDEGDPAAGRERWDWFEAVCAFFAYELKHNQALANIIQSQLLTDLKIEIGSLSKAVERQLQEFGRGMSENFNQVEELLNTMRSEQAEGTASVERRLNTLIPVLLLLPSAEAQRKMLSDVLREERELMRHQLSDRLDVSDAKIDEYVARLSEDEKERHDHLISEIARWGEKARSPLALNAPKDEIPFQAVEAPAVFIGRETELGLLEEKLRSDQKVIIIRGGLGGVGKTALAAAVAHRVRGDFPDGILWDRIDVTDTESTLISFISAFGQHRASRLRYLLNNAAKAGYYRDILSQKRCLVVLDNVENVEQVINLLPSASPGKILVTTRYALKTEIEGAYELNLTTLSHPLAAHLLVDLLGHTPPAVVDAHEQLVYELGCLPLAICIAAGIMRELRWTAVGYLKRFKESSTLDWLGEDSNSAGVRKSFAISYQELPNDTARRAFRTFGAFQQQSISSDLVSHVLGCPTSQAERLILTLVRRGLVEVETHEQMKVVLHPLIRRYAYELLAEAGEEQAAHISAGEWYREKLGAWDSVHQQFDYTVLGNAGDIVNGIQGASHYQQAGLYAQAQEILAAIADIATLHGRDGALLERLDELACVTELVPWLQIYRAHALTASKDAARFAEGEGILDKLTNSADLKIASAALISLAKARLLSRRYSDSEMLLRRSKALKEQLSPPDLKGLAFIENELAHVSLHSGGSYGDALESHRRAMELQRQASDIKGMAYTLRRIASIQLRHFNQPEEALKALDEGEKLAVRTGANLILVLILLEKADGLRRLKFFGDAVAHLEAALDTAKRCDDAFPESHVLKRLGLTYEEVEFYGRAYNCLQKCKTILDGINPEEAESLTSSIGRVWHKINKLRVELDQVGELLSEAEGRGDREESRRLRRRAKRIRQKLNLEPALIRLGRRGKYSAGASRQD